MQHILVPIGFTESAQNTLQYAIDFAAEINAKVFVFRAYSAQSKAGTIINITGIIERETNLYLRTMVKSVDTKNVDVKLISAKGSVVDSVLAIDDDLGIDLIIVGAKSNSSVNLLLVKTPDYAQEDLVLDQNLEQLKSTLTVTENATTFQGVLEHIKTHNPDMLCVFRRKRGFFKKLWEKNTVLKEEFFTTVPVLILKGK